jgi:glutaredoxin
VKITIYTTEPCQKCIAVKRWLGDRGIVPDEEVNMVKLSPDVADEVRARLAQDGYMQAPVIYAEGIPGVSHFQGFDVGELEKIEKAMTT